MKFFLLYFLLLFGVKSYCQKIAGSIILNSGVQDGYTLFSPLNTKTTYLIDNCGRIINSWTSNYFPGNTFYLMPNGNLVRTKRMDNKVITGGGGGGGVEIFDWDSNLLWTFDYNTDRVRQHHDISILPNGNILVLAWVLKTKEEALDAGRDPALLVDDVIWSEEIIEVKPIFPNGSEVVWRWSLWDHLIQDFDATKANFGIVENHPELIDLNYTMTEGIDDWIHANAIDFHPVLNQILISSPFLNEFWIIDHTTTTTEAAMHEGGNLNKGGDILFRWGNPMTYKKGNLADKKLFGQHDVHWIDEGLPHAGKIMLFNNNAGRDFSSIDIINIPMNAMGGYDLAGGKFGPDNAEVVLKTFPQENLFSRIMSGAEMLPNGNVLICSSLQGKLLELTPSNEVVWEYRNPVTVNGIIGRDFNPADGVFSSDPTFRAIKFVPNFIGFYGMAILPGDPIEGEPWLVCETITSTSDDESVFEVYPNPIKDQLIIKADKKISARLITLTGETLRVLDGENEVTMDVSTLFNGIYILILNGKPFKISKVN